MWAIPVSGSVNEPQGVCGGDTEVMVILAEWQLAGQLVESSCSRGTTSMEGRI